MAAETLPDARPAHTPGGGIATLGIPKLPAQPRPAVTSARGRAVLAVILTAQLMVVLDMSIVNIALPGIQHALGFSATGLSWVVNAYTLVFGGLLLLGARSGDLLGRRRTFLAGVAIFILASIVGGFASSSGALLGARAAQGVGAALSSPTALALLMTMFPQPRDRSRAIGYYTAVSIGGAAIGLIAGGLLTEWLSWRWVFFVNVPIAAAVLLGGRLVLPETPRRTGRFDLTGAVTSTAGMTLLVFGFVSAATHGWTATRTVLALLAGAALLVGFVLVELRAAEPITPLRLFADRTRSVAYAARLLLVAAMFGVFFFLTQFLQDVLGYSPIRAGLAFLPLTLCVFAASQLSARVWTQRFGPRYVIPAGLLSFTGLLWLSQLSATSGYLGLLGPLVLFGAGNGTAFVPLTTAGLAGVAPQDAGAASGLVNVTQQVGGSLGLAVLVTVFGHAARSVQAAPGTTQEAAATHAFVVGADTAFAAAAGLLAVVAVLVATALRPPPSA